MQWILQEFEDTPQLCAALDRAGLRWSLHKAVPFTGELIPTPQVADPDDVILFGAYSLWRHAEAQGWRPGMFRIRPFVREAAWAPFLLNGPGQALFLTLAEVPERLPDDDRDWFMRPEDDSKAEPGRVRAAAEIRALAARVARLSDGEIPLGALRNDTALMLTPPARIEREWRLWVAGDRTAAFSLYREGRQVVYRREIDPDALAFARTLVAANPGYAPAYVLDICRTPDGLRMLETNCLNAAGFYAADLDALVAALEAAPRG